MTDTPAERAARLAAGYYNSGDVSPSNPGGLDNDGHVEGLPALLEDVGVVAQQVGLDAAVVAADKAAVAADKADVADMVAAADIANTAAADTLAATLAAAETAMDAAVGVAASHADDAAASAGAAAAALASANLPVMVSGDAGKTPVWSGSAWDKGGPYATAAAMDGKAAADLANVNNTDFASKAAAAGVGGSLAVRHNGETVATATALDFVDGANGTFTLVADAGVVGVMLSSNAAYLVDAQAGVALSAAATVATWTAGWSSVSTSRPTDAALRQYWEVEIVAAPGDVLIGLSPPGAIVSGQPAVGYRNSGAIQDNASGWTVTGGGASTYAAGAVIGVAAYGGSAWFARNGVWQLSGNPAGATNAAISGMPTGARPVISAVANGTVLKFRSQNFVYPAPTGYGAL